MLIYLNGQAKSLKDGMSLAELLAQEKLVTASMAVAVNYQFVPKSNYAKLCLQSGDKVECVTPMQGG